MKKNRFGLIGRRLGHSWSQDYFTRKFSDLGLKDYSYKLFELPSVEELKEWALREGLLGFNVTVPYKVEIIPQLDALDEVATAVGAVNCVTIESGCLIGHNTDAPAFRQTLSNCFPKIAEACVTTFILGTGGAARAVAYALRQLGIGYAFVSRYPDLHANAIGYDRMWTETQHAVSLQKSIMIVNATPVGMWPEVEKVPLELGIMSGDVLVYDLIYNPSPTRLLREAAERGANIKDGLEMLHLQADLSWELFKNRI